MTYVLRFYFYRSLCKNDFAAPVKIKPGFTAGLCFAERPGFEPGVPFRGTHAFQACHFSHSCTSPMVIAKIKHYLKRVHKNEKIYVSVFIIPLFR